MRKQALGWILSCWVAVAGIGFGDEVIFKCGDRLTGTVKTVAGGKMTFSSKVAGTVSLNLADIKTFTTEKPIEVVLKQDETEPVKQTASASTEEGHVLIGDQTDVKIEDIAKVNPPVVKWTGKVTAGASVVKGNTDSVSGNLAFEASRRTEHYRSSGWGAYYFERQKNITTHQEHTTTDKFFLKGQFDWFFTEKNYIYGNLKFEKDRVALLERRVQPGAGFGRQWMEGAFLNLQTELGVTWTDEKYLQATEANQYFSGRFAYHVDKTFWSKVKCYHNFEWIPSAKGSYMYLINADVGLQAPITARLSFDAKIQTAYNNDPADARYRTDTRYLCGISWIF